MCRFHFNRIVVRDADPLGVLDFVSIERLRGFFERQHEISWRKFHRPTALLSLKPGSI